MYHEPPQQKGTKVTATTPGRPDSDLLTPLEVACLFGRDTHTITRWDLAGKFPPGTVIRTLGGHRRYHRAGVQALLNQRKARS